MRISGVLTDLAVRHIVTDYFGENEGEQQWLLKVPKATKIP